MICLPTGTQILVIGLLPPGNFSVSANYSIDGGIPETHSLVPLFGTDSIVGNTTFFTSAPLPFGSHTIDIVLLEAEQSRNYSIDYLEVITPLTVPAAHGPAAISGDKSGANVSAIVGGTLGSLSLVLCAALLYWLRRRSIHRRTALKEPEVFIRQEKHDHGKSYYEICNFQRKSENLIRHRTLQL